jgi:sRNA-binding carbon storage regulator CsrA
VLILTREKDEVVRIIVPPSAEPQVIDVMACEIDKGKARLGFAADPSVKVHRLEVFHRIARGEVKTVPKSQRK